LDLVKATLDLRPNKMRRPWPPKNLALALQGGGSFGAFTWGALDRLLEEECIHFDALSGASAGAVNAVLLASGLASGGREGARKTLEAFWSHVSHSAFLPKAVSLPLGLLTRSLSPYQFNPFDLNPLRTALEAHVDFELLRRTHCPRLLIAATRVTAASLRLFHNEELTVETILASACLPLLHHTIEIDGEPYWDGGYVANPPLTPLVAETDAADVLVIQITPTRAQKAPRTRSEIEHRIDQINFASTLDREIEAIRLLAPLCAAGDASGKWAHLRIDRLSAENEVERLAEASPGNLDWNFLLGLRDAGYAAANAWIHQTDQPPHDDFWANAKGSSHD